MLDLEGERCTNVPDGGVRGGPETGAVGPPRPPAGQAAVGWAFPGIHPDGHDRQEALIGGEFPPALAETGAGDMQQGPGHLGRALHGPKDAGEEAQHRVREGLDLARRPAIEPRGAFSEAPSDENDQVIF